MPGFEGVFHTQNSKDVTELGFNAFCRKLEEGCFDIICSSSPSTIKALSGAEQLLGAVIADSGLQRGDGMWLIVSRADQENLKYWLNTEASSDSGESDIWLWVKLRE